MNRIVVQDSSSSRSSSGVLLLLLVVLPETSTLLDLGSGMLADDCWGAKFPPAGQAGCTHNRRRYCLGGDEILGDQKAKRRDDAPPQTLDIYHSHRSGCDVVVW